MGIDIRGIATKVAEAAKKSRVVAEKLLGRLGPEDVATRWGEIASAAAAVCEGAPASGAVGRQVGRAFEDAFGREAPGAVAAAEVMRTLGAKALGSGECNVVPLEVCLAAAALLRAVEPHATAFDPVPRDGALLGMANWLGQGRIWDVEAASAQVKDYWTQGAGESDGLCSMPETHTLISMPTLSPTFGGGHGSEKPAYTWARKVYDGLRPGGHACLILPNDFMWGLRPEDVALKRLLVEAGAVECVVSLPARLVAGTSVGICLVVLGRPSEQGETCRDILLVNARHSGSKLPSSPNTVLGEEALLGIVQCAGLVPERGRIARHSLPVGGGVEYCVASPSDVERTRWLLAPEMYVSSATVETERRLSPLEYADGFAAASAKVIGLHAELCRQLGDVEPAAARGALAATDALADAFRACERGASALQEALDRTSGESARMPLSELLVPIYAGQTAETGSTLLVLDTRPAGQTSDGAFIPALRAAGGDGTFPLAPDEIAFKVVGPYSAEFVSRLVANTPTGKFAGQEFSGRVPVDVAKFLSCDFPAPGVDAAEALASALRSCERLIDALDMAGASSESSALEAFSSHLAASAPRELGSCAMPCRGEALSVLERVEGSVPTVSAYGVTGSHDTSLTSGASVVVALRGREVVTSYWDGPCWPVASTVFVDQDSCDLPVAYAALAIRAWASGLGRKDVPADPDALKTALKTVSVGDAGGPVLEAAATLPALLEAMKSARGIAESALRGGLARETLR